MHDWMSVEQAAGVLGISSRRVRSLIQTRSLPAERLGDRWLVDAHAVRSRAAHNPLAGRPLSPKRAWMLLAVMEAQLEILRGHGDPNSSDARAHERFRSDVVSNRQDRHALRQLLAEPASPERWASWLLGRARRRRMWGHPGVVARLVADDRVHVGGAQAAAAFGLSSARDDVHRLYVTEDDVAAVIRLYHLSDDPSGQVELMVVSGVAAAASKLLAEPGVVPQAVALADLLDSDDARERYAATTRIEQVQARQPTFLLR